jgi:hypothetical protein
MTRTQFRVLYREFLFRMVDLEILAARADMTKLLAQFGALLAAFSLMLSGGAVRYLYSQATDAERLIGAWTMEHFLIATTMAVVGLFSVLSWDSAFPDRRDVLVLAPLPVRTRTLFLAKVGALATALGFTVLAVNVFTGISWPFALVQAHGGILGGLRSLAAYWITMLAAGAFILCSVLAVQGLAALLPRRQFLRVSGFLQLAAFCLFLSVYFLQPSLTTPMALAAPENQRLLTWLPSYWFLGLFQGLNGTTHTAFGGLERRAWMGLAAAAPGAILAFLLSYFHMLRKVVEEPDIIPGTRAAGWSPRFGNPLETAIVLFSARTLLRSRQHRVILAFYLGIGLAIALAYARSVLQGSARVPWYRMNEPLLISSVVMICIAVMGVRTVFSMPLELRANWIFRITAVRGAPEYMAAIRRSLIVLGVAPVWGASAVLFLSIWPPWPAAAHLAVLGFLGILLVDLRLHGFQKVPFTCSYMPGQANVHVTSGAYGIVLLALAEIGVQIEFRRLRDLAGYSMMLAVLGAAAIWAKRRTAARAKSPEAALQFEETPPKDIFALELHRDGVIPR